MNRWLVPVHYGRRPVLSSTQRATTCANRPTNPPVTRHRNHTRYEPQHDKTNKMTHALSEDSDQPGHQTVWSESSLSAWRNLGSLATHWTHSKASDQTWRMLRLIRVFAGRTGDFVGFVVLWLIQSLFDTINPSWVFCQTQMPYMVDTCIKTTVLPL